MGVSRQQGHALVREAVTGQIELLQDAVRLFRKSGCRKRFQFVCRCVQEPQAAMTKRNKIPLISQRPSPEASTNLDVF